MFLKFDINRLDNFGVKTCLKLSACDIEDSSYILPDRLALLDHRMEICDNVIICLSLSQQLYKQVALRIIVGLYAEFVHE